MGKVGTPYIKVEKIGGLRLITIMKGVPGGHVLAARGECVRGDPSAFEAEVKRCLAAAGVREASQEMQANG